MNAVPVSWNRILPPSPQSPAGTVAQGTVVKSSTVVSEAMSIATAEGDTVTISASSRLDAGFATYEQMSRNAGFATLVQARSMDIGGGSNFSIALTGDLDHREIQDIRRAVHYLEKAGKELVNGDPDGAERKLLDLGKLKSLSEISAVVQVQSSISIAQQSET